MANLRILPILAACVLGAAGARYYHFNSTIPASPVHSPVTARAADCSTPTTSGKITKAQAAWMLSPVPGAKRGSYAEFSRVLTLTEWKALSDKERGMLRQRIRMAHSSTPIFSTCFAPGADPTVVRAFARVQSAISNFRQVTRWTSTANGSVSQGGPMTLTWNLVTDGTTIAPMDDTSDPTTSNLRAYVATAYGSEENFRAQLRTVFARYEQLTGIRYVEVNYDDGAAIPSTGALNVRADIRIGGSAIDGFGNVLAYDYFPNYSDMVLDTSDSLLSNQTTAQNPNPLLLLRNTVSHEHGHGLGLDHVCPVNETKLMEPYVSYKFEGPQLDDIQADQNYYGDTYESPAQNNSTGAATNLGTLAVGSKTIDTVSIGDQNDTDFYKFNTDASSRKLTATVAVPYSSYLEGAQNSDGSCSAGTTFNPANRRNLGVRILNSSGTVLSEANTAAAGSSETLTINALSGTGPFYAQVFSVDGLTVSQMYTLTLTTAVGTSIGAKVSGRCVSIFAGSDFNSSQRSGIASATVILKNSSGTTIGTTSSDSNGNYSFANVTNGNYSVVAQYHRDASTVITLDPPTRAVTVSGADVAVTRFALYSVFGIVKAPNKQGTIVPLSGATVHLINPAGAEIGTKTTGTDGHYEFKNQRAATFTIKVDSTNFTFPNKSVTTPSSGSNWSPAARANIVGTRVSAGLAPTSPSGDSS